MLFIITIFQTYKNIDMKQKTNKLAQFKQWILSIVMWRYSLLFLVILPTPIFIIIDPMCETTFSNIWIVFGVIALPIWYRFIFNAT